MPVQSVAATEPFDEIDPLGVRRNVGSGGIVVLVDDLSPWGTATLVVDATAVTTTTMARLIEHGSGWVEIVIDYATARRLNVVRMAGADLSEYPDVTRPVYGVAVDAADGVTTGISAADRARTAHVVASSGSVPTDLCRPGHLATVLIGEQARMQPCFLAAGAFALVHAATGSSAAVHCELVAPTVPDRMASVAEATDFGRMHDLPVVPMSALIQLARSARSNRVMKRSTSRAE